MSFLPAPGNRGVFLALVATVAIVLVWVVSAATGVVVPEMVWWSILGANGFSAARGASSDLGRRIAPPVDPEHED